MKLWIDDIRPAPYGYTWVKSVNEAKRICIQMLTNDGQLLIDMDHDAGDYTELGGDYIHFLIWLEERWHLNGWTINTTFTKYYWC